MKKTALFLAILMIVSAFTSATAIAPVTVEVAHEVQTAELFGDVVQTFDYEFANTVSGNADGIITVSSATAAPDSTTVTLYYANEEGKLADFTKLAKLALDENGNAAYTVSGSRAFPKGATKIVAEFSGENAEVVTYEYVIPEEKRMPDEEPLYSFYASSDLHLGQGYGKVPRFTADILANKGSYDFIIMNGDIVNHGLAEEYAQYNEWYENTIVANEIPYFVVNGNHSFHVKGPNGDAADGTHDYEGLLSIYDKNDKYLLDTFGIDTDRGEDKLFYSVEYKGAKLIFLSSPSFLSAPQPYYYITDEQLEWLENELFESEKSNRPVFVITHLPIDDFGTTPDSERNGDEEINNKEDVEAILDRHPNVVLISSHTHQNFFLEDQVNVVVGDMKNEYTHFNTGSVQYVKEGNNQTSYSLTTIVEAYEDKIIVRGKQLETTDTYNIAYRYYMISLPDTEKNLPDVTMSNTNAQIGDTVSALVDGSVPDEDMVCEWYINGELVYTGADYKIEKHENMPGRKLALRVTFEDGTYAGDVSEGTFDGVEVKYDLNGAAGTTPAPQRAFAGDTVELYESTYVPQKDGMFFVGWSTDKNATRPILKIKADEDITVYAVFTDKPEFLFDSLSGWTKNGAYANGYVEDGVFKYTSSETNGDIVISRAGPIDADKYRYVRVKSTAANNPDGFFFQTKECGYDASKTRITLGTPVATVGGFAIYERDILSLASSKDYWKGTITRIRYDAFNKTNTYGETDYIVFSDKMGVYGANVNVDEKGVYVSDGALCSVSDVVWNENKITVTLAPDSGYEFTTEEDVMSLVTVNASAVESAYVSDGVAVVSYTFDEKPVVGIGAPETLELATIRTDTEAQGIRFASYLRKDQRKAAFEYGFIISTAGSFAYENEYEEKLVFDGSESVESGKNSHGVKFVSGKAYLTETPGMTPSVDKVFALDGSPFGFEGREGIYFTAVLKNIPKNRYFDVILCRAYLITEDGIVYGNIVERSIKQVAESIVEKQYGGDVDAAPEYIRDIYNAKNEGRESFMDIEGLY